MSDANSFVIVDDYSDDLLSQDAVVLDMEDGLTGDFVVIDTVVDESDFIALADDVIIDMDTDIIDLSSSIDDMDFSIHV